MNRSDPITVEVVRNTLPAIANEMSLDLQRASYNMMIYEVRDYCCALLNPKGELLSQNMGAVSHFVADLGVVIRDSISRYGVDGFSPGDVLITNHQRIGGQHLNNVCVYTPVFHAGELRGFAVIRAHWVDVGGMSTGFGSDGAYDPWIEGLQLDQLKIYNGGRADEQMLRMIKDNIRMPERSMGDLRAQIAGCQLAERRFSELDERYGSATIDDAIERVFAQTEERCRQVVAEIPDGVYKAESSISGRRLSSPIEIRVKVSVSGTDMEIDLSECSQERTETVNSRTHAGALIPYKAITGPTEPLNEGSFRGVNVVIPEGNIMMAQYPAPMSSWSFILPTVAETILLALAPAVPGRIPACTGKSNAGITFFGIDARGRRFLSSSIEGRGWGGRPFEDGPSASVSIIQGDTRNGSIELLEHKVPFIVEERALIQDSGAPGKFRGGLTVGVKVRTLIEGNFNMRRSSEKDVPPSGLWGGKNGSVGQARFKLPDENDFQSEINVSRFLAPPGTVVASTGGGGAGWGDPLERDPAAVLGDLIEELISPESAFADYGVVVIGVARVDERATAERRAVLRGLQATIAE